MKKELLLIDGHGLAFRGFYALPQELAASDGTPTNAVLGFFNMMLKALDEWPSEGLGIFFDPKGQTRRHEIFEQYKKTRRPTPENFRVQLPLIIELCRAMGFPVFSREGVEADDFIVSTAKSCAAAGWDVKILSADKDLFQAIDEGISVLRPSRGVTDFNLYDEASFREKYGFEPPLMADYLALVGDAADNIPGVAGIGKKSALELVAKYGSLEKIYENIDDAPKGRRAKLEAGRADAFASRELVVPQQTEAAREEELIPKEPSMEELAALCSRLGLKKIYSRFLGGAEIETEFAAARNVTASEPLGEETELERLVEADELSLVPADEGNFARLVASAADGKFAAFDAGDERRRAIFAEWAERGKLLLLGYREMLSELPDFPLPAHTRIYDVENAHYLLHPDRGAQGMEKSFGEAIKTGEALARRLFAYREALAPQLEKYGLTKVMQEIDMPLAPALAKMKRTGLHADLPALELLAEKLASSIEKCESDIKEYAGVEINLASPKQVGELLFGKLMLPPIKTTKGGAYSTNIEVLEELSKLPEPLCDVPKMLIEHREESKVLHSFVLPFIKYASEGGGLIHSTFDHLATGTGRLASRDPNVQNMPVFGEWADSFRACFTPRVEDGVFVAADYSQIELRVLAELTGEEKLLRAFADGGDVHLETASWVFGLPASEITAEQRRFAKVVNFGLLYGMSTFGLSGRLGVPRPAAQQIIDRYFSVLPRVKDYITESAAEAKKRGHTRSLFGRIRPLSEVSTTEGRGAGAINRVAVNTPIQSAASDIAKIALLRFDAALAEKFPSARIVLQVHDSIVCECRESEAEGVTELLVKTMESVEGLSVPLKAEPKRGRSLREV